MRMMAVWVLVLVLVAGCAEPAAKKPALNGLVEGKAKVLEVDNNLGMAVLEFNGKRTPGVLGFGNRGAISHFRGGFAPDDAGADAGPDERQRCDPANGGACESAGETGGYGGDSGDVDRE